MKKYLSLLLVVLILLSVSACDSSTSSAIDFSQNNYDDDNYDYDNNSNTFDNNDDDNGYTNNTYPPSNTDAMNRVGDFLYSVFNNSPDTALNYTLCSNRFWSDSDYHEMLSEFETALYDLHEKLSIGISATFTVGNFDVYLKGDPTFLEFTNPGEFWDEDMPFSIDVVSAVAIGGCEITLEKDGKTKVKDYTDKILLYYIQDSWYILPESVFVILNDYL